MYCITSEPWENPRQLSSSVDTTKKAAAKIVGGPSIPQQPESTARALYDNYVRLHFMRQQFL